MKVEDGKITAFRTRIAKLHILKGIAGKCGKMAHQRRANALPLIFVDHSERHLGCSRAHYDITSASDDCGSAPFSRNGDPRDVVGEIDVQEEVNFLLRKNGALGRRNVRKATGYWYH